MNNQMNIINIIKLYNNIIKTYIKNKNDVVYIASIDKVTSLIKLSDLLCSHSKEKQKELESYLNHLSEF